MRPVAVNCGGGPGTRQGIVVAKVDLDGGYNRLELSGTFRTSDRLYFGKYQLGGFQTEEGTFAVIHRLFRPESSIG